MVSRVLLSVGNKLDWLTPQWLFDELNSEFHFELDTATCRHNPLNTPSFYTQENDGLKGAWINPTFCNPPYSAKNITPWLDKAVTQQHRGVTSVFLLPSRTGNKWFHNYVYHKPDVEFRFLKGRLLFRWCKQCYPNHEENKNAAPFDSLIVIFRGNA